jgi:translation initiation factor IF-2
VSKSRLNKVALDFNVGVSTIVEFLKKKGHSIVNDPNTSISPEMYALLSKEYKSDVSAKIEADKLNLRNYTDKKKPKTEQTKKASTDEDDGVHPPIMIKDTSSGIKSPFSNPAMQGVGVKMVGKMDIVSDRNRKKREREKRRKEARRAEQQALEAKQAAEGIKQQTGDAKQKPTETRQQAGDNRQRDREKEAQNKNKQTSPNLFQKQEELPLKQTDVEEKTATAQKAEPKEVERLLRTPELDADNVKVIGKIDLSAINQFARPAKRKNRSQIEREKREAARQRAQTQNAQQQKSDKNLQVKPVDKQKEKIELTKKSDIKLTGPNVVGKIDLANDASKKKKKRKRVSIKNEKVVVTNKAAQDQKQQKNEQNQSKARRFKKVLRPEVSEDDVQKQIKETLSRLTSKTTKSKTAKYRRDKRDAVSQKMMEEEEMQMAMRNTIKVTEFATVNEIAAMMDVPVTKVIGTCMNMGLFVSINQRLNAETMALVVDEFNFKLEFISADAQDVLVQTEDDEADLLPRFPIVTVMGHVDHGKTKLLDYIRNANVIAGEAGGITQHIGAYNVELEKGKHITFLDTPGHEAFSAMRARGAKVTDVVIIVVAADDGVKQQTVEAINHASAAGVPIVFAINKIDKRDANPDRVKEELSQMNYLVEDWGGRYQSQEISAKGGTNIDLLLEKVLLEAEMLELRANPNRMAVGSVIESSLDKGRGYVATVLVQNGTLRTGDVVLAGNHAGHIKAMYNERNQKITEAGPAMPVLILGLDGAPQAGDMFNVLDDFREAREIAAKRSQLQREQGMRTKKHITLDEIGRRIAIGNFKELNIIVKGDVDGSVEALADSLIRLSKQEIQLNVIHKAVGQISESDVVLAAASNAIIIGFQVRPSVNARKLAEQEQIDVRIYSIIYNAIEEIQAAMEGMLAPEIREEITATLEIREVFNITKVGTIAGCIVREGKIARTARVRIIRDGIVIHTGELGSLKRFKDDVKEVSAGYECGLDIANFNDIAVGDIIEGFVEVEVKKKL